nr:PREDICTED: RNA-directed DNA polymerase homolog [Tribolium castaneum]|eukprot:XP_015839387.1 PREDICTED: RNA-directed DNA polymerase homolog [Tribolium castaneum]
MECMPIFGCFWNATTTSVYNSFGQLFRSFSQLLQNTSQFKMYQGSWTTVYRPYRISFSEKEQVRNIVRELKEADIIEETDSPFASPVILVKKKSGEVRMCVDYRALNKKTVKQHYPLPLIDDQLDRLRGQIYFTSVDLSMGYHQVPMSIHARGKTAFINPDGVYCFKRMSFGLANAPSQFQRLINIVVGNLRYDTAMAYLDDICRMKSERS